MEWLAQARLSDLTSFGLSGKVGSYPAGRGGNAYGIRLAHVTDVSLTGSNYIGKLYGGAGAAGSNGGAGGVAQAISVSGDNVALSFSNVVIEYIYGGAGAAAIASGGAAVALRITNASDNSLTLVYRGAGSQGGHGGTGGQSERLLCDHCSQVTLTNNGFAGIHGAAGALGANGGPSLFGLTSGGNGGNGGHGTGLYWRGVFRLNQGSSYGTINAGIGAWGGATSGRAGVKVD